MTMVATITRCPFKDTELLAECAVKGIEPYEQQIQDSIALMKSLGLQLTATKLDDTYLAAINGAQNETIRSIVCRQCNKDSECHPPT